MVLVILVIWVIYGSVRLIAQAICFDNGFKFGGQKFWPTFTDLGILGQNFVVPSSMRADLFSLGRLDCLQNRPKTRSKKHPKRCKNTKKSSDLATSSQSFQTKKSKAKQNRKFPKRQLSVRNIFLSYPWMAARNFYGVTGELKGHSHILEILEI